MIAGRAAPPDASLAPLVRPIFTGGGQQHFAALRTALRSLLQTRPDETLECILARNPRALPLRELLEALEEAVFCSEEMLEPAAVRVQRLLL